MAIALAWPSPDPFLEAVDSPARRAQRANRAAASVIQDRHALERAAVQRLAKRLAILKNTLRERLLAGQGGLTDFQRFNVTALAGEVDRLVAQTTADLATGAEASYQRATDLAVDHATEPLKAAQLAVGVQLPGLDAQLVTSAFDNTVDLLTPPMQQFGTDVKVGLRRVALAGDNRFEEIQRLRDKISGAGFQNAQFRAERIIRTELGRTFNEASFQRFVGLARDFPFLRKGWRATKDSRTRQGHREAGARYGRGQGIVIAGGFKVNVYQEGKGGSGGKMLGAVALRFPVDPQATPAGKLAAAATIMCRCNAFVDFDMSEFAQWAKSRVQVAVGQPPVPTGPPTVPPAPVPIRPKTRTPRRRAAPKAPRTTQPTPRPAPAAGGPVGPKVSEHVAVPAGAGRLGVNTYARKSLSVIDSVHGDGPLNTIKMKVSKAGRYYGQYSSQWGRGGTSITLSESGMKAHPLLTMAHETGHFLDSCGVGKAPGAAPIYTTGIVRTGRRVGRWTTGRILGAQPGAPAGYSRIGEFATYGSYTAPEMQALMGAIDGSKSITALKRWQTAGNSFVSKKHLRYLLTVEERFARSYAQYVATASGDQAMLAELRGVQAHIATDADGPAWKSETDVSGVGRSTAVVDYPSQWSDDDFAPIKVAFDNLFKALGWMK